MKTDIRMIALDLDDTTLNREKQITKRVSSAISAAIAKGVVVLPATGRSVEGIPKSVLAISGIRYAATSNGAMIYSLPEKEVLYSDCFTLQNTLRLLELCEGFETAVGVFINGQVFSQPANFEEYFAVFGEKALAYIRASRNFRENLPEFVQQSGYDVEKFSLLFRPNNMQERARAMEFFSQSELCSVTSSMPTNLELNTPSANKGAALVQLGSMLNILPSQIMAVGDGLNDLDMLRAVGHPVAMGNAAPELFEVAAKRTADCDQDGVALAIEEALGLPAQV